MLEIVEKKIRKKKTRDVMSSTGSQYSYDMTTQNNDFNLKVNNSRNLQLPKSYESMILDKIFLVCLYKEKRLITQSSPQGLVIDISNF